MRVQRDGEWSAISDATFTTEMPADGSNLRITEINYHPHNARVADGELDVRLGNALLNTGQYADCVKSVEAGIRKGGLKSPDNAQISLGMCLYNQRKYNTAVSAFQKAAKTPRSRKIANQWINVIRAEIERNEQIRLAEDAARKKRAEIEERRAKAGRA